MTEAENLFIPGPAGRLSVRTKGMAGHQGKVVVLVQGSNLSGQTGYDFTFNGGADYSMMDALAAPASGPSCGAVTFALRGYGESDPPVDPLACGTETAVEDLRAVMDWLQALGVAQISLLGWSWGARIIGHYAASAPERVSRVIFLGPAIGGGDPILPAPTEPWWRNTREEYRTRLDPALMDSDALEALIDHITTADPRAPNAIRVENARGSIPINPDAIICPALLIYGSEGGKQAYMKGVTPRAEFFEKLATSDKLLAVVPDSSDYAMFQGRRRQVQHIVRQFIHAPSG